MVLNSPLTQCAVSPYSFNRSNVCEISVNVYKLCIYINTSTTASFGDTRMRIRYKPGVSVSGLVADEVFDVCLISNNTFCSCSSTHSDGACGVNSYYVAFTNALTCILST